MDNRPTARIASLDGLRGIAILIVFQAHLSSMLLGGMLHPWQNGQHGVALFFVLSGFLITRNLTANSNLRSFYIRRAFRLMPVAWLYLLVVFTLHRTDLPEVISALAFYRNCIEGGGTFVGHFWSLSLEEQFYLVWPGFLVLLGIRNSRWLLIAAILSSTLYRFLHWHFFTTEQHWQATAIHLDGLGLGCLLALTTDGLRKWLRWLLIPAIAIITLSISSLTDPLIPLYENLAFAVLVGAAAFDSSATYTRILQLKPLVYVGMISYSVYVWQQLFIFVPLHWMTISRIALAASVFPAAALSFYLLEEPMTNWGRRLSLHHSAKIVSHVALDTRHICSSRAD